MTNDHYSDQELAPLVTQLGRPGTKQLTGGPLSRVTPAGLGFGPDFALLTRHGHALVQTLIGELPDGVPSWILRASTKTRPDLSVLLIAQTDKAAANAINHCLEHGFGLAVVTATGVQLVIPPNYVQKPVADSDPEHGHIPSWLLERINGSPAFSEYFGDCLSRFISSYSRITQRPPTSKAESRALYAFAECIVDGDERLFCPVNLLHTLQQFEQGGADLSSRDHFSHTFNDFFIGLAILKDLPAHVKENAIPQRFVRDTSGISQLKTWEMLWSITCLLHDIGYLAEKAYSTISFTLGIQHDTELDPDELPEASCRQLDAAWDTNFGAARRDLYKLYEKVSGRFMAETAGERIVEFDEALRRAYFDGHRTSHSVISGLSLIERCTHDKTIKNEVFDLELSLKACEIAALGMLFHDPSSRNKLITSGVPPVPFELLPYASVLMFADALQDDRRDIGQPTWRCDGVLRSLNVDATEGVVKATVCLDELPSITWWPFKIVEYESVLAWLNQESSIKFEIDYRSLSGLEL